MFQPFRFKKISKILNETEYFKSYQGSNPSPIIVYPLPNKRAWSDYKDEERFRGQEQPIVECWVFDITGKPSDELRHILRKLQADDPGGAKRRRILTYLTKVRTLCARAYGAPAIRGPIKDSYLSFLPTRVH